MNTAFAFAQRCSTYFGEGRSTEPIAMRNWVLIQKEFVQICFQGALLDLLEDVLNSETIPTLRTKRLRRVRTKKVTLLVRKIPGRCLYSRFHTPPVLSDVAEAPPGLMR